MSLNIKSFGTLLCEENVASTSEDSAPRIQLPNSNLIEDAMSNVQFEDQAQGPKMAEVKHENFDHYSAYAAALYDIFYIIVSYILYLDKCLAIFKLKSSFSYMFLL